MPPTLTLSVWRVQDWSTYSGSIALAEEPQDLGRRAESIRCQTLLCLGGLILSVDNPSASIENLRNRTQNFEGY
jgi:hypothetical protein